MPRKTKVELGGFRIDCGEYGAIITSLEDGYHEKFKENYIWKVKIKEPTLDGDEMDEEVELLFYTGQKLTKSNKNKLAKLVKAVSGKTELDLGAEIELDDLVGLPVRVIVKDNPKEDGIYSVISDFLPMRKKKKVKEEPEEKVEKKSDEKPEKEEKPEEKKKVKVEENEKEEESGADDDLFKFSDE